MRAPAAGTRASILVWTVLTIAILSMLGAEVLRLVSIKHQSALQTATWQEALLAAESGIDLGIIELRKSLYPMPNHAWEGWNNTPANGVVSYGISTIANAGLAGVWRKWIDFDLYSWGGAVLLMVLLLWPVTFFLVRAT